MKKIIYLLLLIFVVSCQTSLETSSETQRPNIILILVDDLGKEWVSAYGAEDVSTPHVDALAASGIRFDNVYAMPQCTPSRLTILTGQYPFRHGWVNHWDVPRWGGGAHYDENRNPSLGMEMKKAGYTTCIAGKWQIDDFRVEPDALTRNGFDHYCMWTGYESGIPESGERYQDPYLYQDGQSRTRSGDFGPDVFTEYICDFIRKPKDQPFFVFYPMVLTHPPLVNTPDETADDPIGKHKAMVRYMDKITGKIINTLEEAKVRDNTLIVWTTDNGTSRGLIGNYQGRKVNGAKAKTTEPGICVPFLVSWKDQIAPGQVSDALIDFSDIFPTFLDLAGRSPQKEWMVHQTAQPIDGQSFKAVLLQTDHAPQRDWILGMGGGNNARLTENGVENQYRFRDRVLRNKQYKLYVGANRKPEKFIDLANDPEEQINLLDSLNTEERNENFQSLSKLIAMFPLQDNDPRYVPNPDQSWDVEISAESEVWKQ